MYILYVGGYYKEYKKSGLIIGIFIGLTILFYIIISNEESIKKICLTSEVPIYDNIIILLLSMAISINLDGIIAIFLQKIYEKRIINQFEKKYNVEAYDYYRDILKNESPAILSYCYNKKINVEDEVVATLLNLRQKNIIEINENQLKIIGDINLLSEHEKYILNNFKNIDKKNSNIDY